LVDPDVELRVITECSVKELVRWIWTDSSGTEHKTVLRFLNMLRDV
jgi:hypothetical protein